MANVNCTPEMVLQAQFVLLYMGIRYLFNAKASS